MTKLILASFLLSQHKKFIQAQIFKKLFKVEIGLFVQRHSRMFALTVVLGKEVMCNSLVGRFAVVFYFGNQFFYFH